MENREVGERIKCFRKRKGLTQNALANEAGISPTYVYQLERGEKSPTVEYLGHICWGLGITLQEFFAEHETTGGEKENIVGALNADQRKLLNDFLNSLKLK